VSFDFVSLELIYVFCCFFCAFFKQKSAGFCCLLMLLGGFLMVFSAFLFSGDSLLSESYPINVTFTATSARAFGKSRPKMSMES
jgi:hypothetical protein